jgi:hypothetical protein
MASFRFTTLGVATFSVVALCWACSSSKPSATSDALDGSVEPPGLDGSVADAPRGDAAPAVRDANPDGDNPDGSLECNGTTAAGGSIGATYVPGTRPVAVGGTIGAGTYVLTERATFIDSWEGNPANPPPDVPVTRTLVVAGNTLYAAEIGSLDGGAPTQLRSNATFQAFDVTLSLTSACPFSGGAPTNVGFSVVGNDLWIFPSLYSRELYTRQ